MWAHAIGSFAPAVIGHTPGGFLGCSCLASIMANRHGALQAPRHGQGNFRLRARNNRMYAPPNLYLGGVMVYICLRVTQ
jgi:hypothetical protein